MVKEKSYATVVKALKPHMVKQTWVIRRWKLQCSKFENAVRCCLDFITNPKSFIMSFFILRTNSSLHGSLLLCSNIPLGIIPHFKLENSFTGCMHMYVLNHLSCDANANLSHSSLLNPYFVAKFSAVTPMGVFIPWSVSVAQSESSNYNRPLRII